MIQGLFKGVYRGYIGVCRFRVDMTIFIMQYVSWGFKV